MFFEDVLVLRAQLIFASFPQRRHEINTFLFIVFASMTGFHDATPIIDRESSAYLASSSGGSNPGISCTVRWIRNPEACNSGIDKSTASNSLGDGSYAAGGTLLLTSDM